MEPPKSGHFKPFWTTFEVIRMAKKNEEEEFASPAEPKGNRHRSG